MEDNPGRAATFTRELRTACEGLGDTPLSFAMLEIARDRGYRRRIFGNYAIVYTVGDREVMVVRVLSSAADIKAMFDA